MSENRDQIVVQSDAAVLAQSVAKPDRHDTRKAVLRDILWRLIDDARTTNGMHNSGELAEKYAAKIALAQSDAGPVGWECRPKCLDGQGREYEWSSCAKWQYDDQQSTYEYRALYTSPPRPDASAGLIEAAEWHEGIAFRLELEISAFSDDPNEQKDLRIVWYTHKESAEKLRARAADRSGK